MTKYYQCELKSDTRKDTVWLDEDHAVKGKRITLLDSDTPEIKWTVDRVYQIGLTRENFKRMQEFHRKWHNNI